MKKSIILFIVFIVVGLLISGLILFSDKEESLKNKERQVIFYEFENESPFGFIMGTPTIEDQEKNLNGIADVGAGWVRLSGSAGIIWGLIEKEKGNYDWTIADSEISEFYKKGINILVTIGPANKAYKSQRGYYPGDIDAYNAFLLKTVERYDGDGVDDAPGSPIVAAWQISNEIDTEGEWKDDLKNYAKLMKESYLSIKSANPQSIVVVAGVAAPFGVSKYSKILSHMEGGVYFDVFDFHWHAMFGGDYKINKTRDSNVSYAFDNYLSDVRNILKTNGYENAKIWITEMSASDTGQAGQTEKSQAIDLIKRYIYSGSKGVDAIFWGTIYEQAGFAGKSGNENYFNTQGLINNPKNDGLSHKKLAYYSYKKMVEILEDSDWSNVKTIQEKDGIYVYKFTKHGKAIFVAWNDNKEEKQATIFGIDSSEVKITEAVPKYESGKEVSDYTTAFETETRSVDANKIAITLKDKPVFIEAR